MKKVGRGWKLGWIAGALLFVLPLFGASKSNPGQAGKAFAIPEGGIRLTLLAGAEKQLPPALSATARLRDEKTLLYTQAQLWSQAQKLVLWTTPAGAVISLSLMRYRPPAKPAELVSGGGKMSWTEFPDAPSEQECLEWLSLFFEGLEFTKGSKVSGGSDFEWTRYPVSQPKFLVLAGRRRKTSGPAAVVMVDWRKVAGADDRVWERVMTNRVTSPTAIPLKQEEAPKLDSTQAGSYTVRLALAKKSIAGLDGWNVVETPHYIFITNQSSRRTVRQLQNELEAARQGFQLYYPVEDESLTVGVVKIFAKRQEYLQQLPPGHEWSGGVWDSSKLELLVSPLDVKVDKKTAAKWLREATFHEAFHQYLYYASGEHHAAPWFNEGSAMFFEHSSPQQGDFGVLDEELEQKLAQAASDAPDNLKKFLLLDYEGYYAEKKRDFNYDLGHALMYYLLRGAPALGEKEFAELPARYLEALRATGDNEKAMARILENLDTKKLSASLKKFWSSRSQIQKAKRFKKQKK